MHHHRHIDMLTPTKYYRKVAATYRNPFFAGIKKVSCGVVRCGPSQVLIVV